MIKIDREKLRDDILYILHQAGAGLKSDAILHGMRRCGYSRLEEAALEDELRYLRQKAFVEEQTSVLSAGTMRYALAAAGREYLEANKLI